MRGNQIISFPLLLLCLAAAAPNPSPTSEVKAVPAERAMAILGRQVEVSSGKEIGRLIDVLVDEDGTPQAAVIDFGGFMGVGNRRIAVEWSTLRFAPSNLRHAVTVEMSPDQLKAAPQYENPDKAVQVVAPLGGTSPTAEAGSRADHTAPPN